jgi:hypothetical protein
VLVSSGAHVERERLTYYASAITHGAVAGGTSRFVGSRHAKIVRARTKS